MLFACDQCYFLFEAEKQPERCPDCGKKAVRPADEREQDEYQNRRKEFESK